MSKHLTQPLTEHLNSYLGNRNGNPASLVSGSEYLRPDGTSVFFRPDGTSKYKRPSS